MKLTYAFHITRKDSLRFVSKNESRQLLQKRRFQCCHKRETHRVCTHRSIHYGSRHPSSEADATAKPSSKQTAHELLEALLLSSYSPISIWTPHMATETKITPQSATIHYFLQLWCFQQNNLKIHCVCTHRSIHYGSRHPSSEADATAKPSSKQTAHELLEALLLSSYSPISIWTPHMATETKITPQSATTYYSLQLWCFQLNYGKIRGKGSQTFTC